MKLFPKSNKDLKEKVKRQKLIIKQQDELLDQLEKAIENEKKEIRDSLGKN